MQIRIIKDESARYKLLTLVPGEGFMIGDQLYLVVSRVNQHNEVECLSCNNARKQTQKVFLDGNQNVVFAKITIVADIRRNAGELKTLNHTVENIRLSKDESLIPEFRDKPDTVEADEF